MIICVFKLKLEQKAKTGNNALSREMVDNVTRMNNTVAVALKGILVQIGKLRDKKYHFRKGLEQFEGIDLEAAPPDQKRS